MNSKTFRRDSFRMTLIAAAAAAAVGPGAPGAIDARVPGPGGERDSARRDVASVGGSASRA